MTGSTGNKTSSQINRQHFSKPNRRTSPKLAKKDVVCDKCEMLIPDSEPISRRKGIIQHRVCPPPVTVRYVDPQELTR